MKDVEHFGQGVGESETARLQTGMAKKRMIRMIKTQSEIFILISASSSAYKFQPIKLHFVCQK